MAGEVWVHIDRLDRRDGKVWAVQYWTRTKGLVYHVAKDVQIHVPTFTRWFGRSTLQPRAVLVVRFGKVFIGKNVTEIYE